MPSAPFVVPPLLLIGILLVSAVAKIRDPRDTRSVFSKLRLPRFLDSLRAPVLLPYGELVVAAALLLLPGPGYTAAATATLLVFVAYLVVVVRALRFGYPIMCGCFGQLGLGWITRQTALRNAWLAGVALVAWVDSWRGDGVLARLRDLGSDWWWLAGVAVAVVTTALVVHESAPPPFVPPEEGEEGYIPRPVPYLPLDTPEGPRSVWALLDSAARLLVFLDLREHPLPELADRVQRWQEHLAPVQVHVVHSSEWRAAAELRPDLAAFLLGDPEGEARARLAVPIPGAVILGTDRLLAGGPVSGLDEIEELVDAAAEELGSVSAEG